MATEQPRKTADPRDKDKMIRQLSLVAYLMSVRGRKVDADSIRLNVEGYGDVDQKFEAFTRRFFADREELGSIGIEVEHERDEFGDGDVYWLPRENFFLPRVEFSAAELMAINACLQLLGGQFAYSRLLRLALQGLALGSGNRLDDPVTIRASVNLLSSGYDSEVAARLTRLESAISRRKTITFDYHSMGRDAAEERRVDPYGLFVYRGDWYLAGLAHERGDTRVFKLRRMTGRIRYASKSEHDFKAPEGFDIRSYASQEPWQLGPPRGQAVIRFSPLMGWWARNNLSHCGSVESDEDGGAGFTTSFSNPHELCSLVLGLGAEAVLEEPEELRGRIRSSLEKVAALHEGEPPRPAPAAAEQPGPRPPLEGEAPQVEPEHFSQLARTVSYLVDRLDGSEEITMPMATACADLGLEREALEKDLELLLLVSASPGVYLVEAYVDGDELRVTSHPEGEMMRQPVHLTPREARAMILAFDLVGSQILSGQFRSLESAREKIIAAAGGLDELAIIPVGETAREDFSICRAVNRGLSENLLVEIEYLSQDSGALTRRVVEPCLINRTKGQWYLVAWCRVRDAIRTFRFAMMKSARLLDEAFTPRDIDLEPYLADPRLPSGASGARTAEVWFSPDTARWVLELEPNTTLLEDGALVSRIPFFSERWLTEEILKYQGEAVLLSPESSRLRVADTAAGLLSRYSRSS
ncbi:MAG: WYL domain-containing protein [Gaiellales bacterium]|nr:MAG: WYL domain-containing protein [Gaiellales bacterium]